MKKELLVLSVGVLFLFAVLPGFAHHGTAGYDMGKITTVTGTVTKVDWSNPHIVIHIDAKNASGNLQHWSLELSAPLLMTRLGWTKDSIKAGDQVVAETHAAKNGAPVGASGSASFLLKFVVNGTPLPHL